MGVDYNACVVVGVPFNKLLKENSVKKTITKYDPDTGKPYRKTEVAKEWLFCGKVVDEPYSAVSIAEANGLKVCTNGMNETDDGTIIGVFMGEVGDGADFNKEITFEKLGEARLRVIESFQKIGYNTNKENINVHLVFWAG